MKAVNKKIIATVIALCLLSALASGVLVHALSSSDVSNTTAMEGSMLDGYSWIIYQQSTTVYRRDGVTGEVYTGTDFTTVVQNAIDDIEDGSPYKGGSILIKAWENFYEADSSIYVNEGRGWIHIYGEGRRATKIRGMGDYPVFIFNGTKADNIQSPTVANMWIRGGTKSNTNAHCLELRWTHSGTFENLWLDGCYDAIHIVRDWQSTFRNIKIWSAGDDAAGPGNSDVQNGIVTEERAHEGSIAQNGFVLQDILMYKPYGDGLRLKSASGIKATDVEIQLPQDNGLHIGGESADKFGSHFNHFENLLIDQAQNHGVFVEQSSGEGKEETCHDLWFNNLWTRASGTAKDGVHLDGVHGIEFNGGFIHASEDDGLYATGCGKISITGVQFKDNAQGTATGDDVHFHDTSDSTITGCIMVTGPDGSQDKCVETEGSSNYNTIVGNNLRANGITTVGANTITADNQT